MNYKQITLGLIFLFCVLGFNLKAQENERKNALTFVITQPLFKGLRLEYERNISGRWWAYVSPMHFGSKQEFWDADSFWGVGGALGAKMFLDKDENGEEGFLLGTLEYNYFDMQQTGFFIEESTWNGFPTFSPKEAQLYQHVNRIRGMISLGAQGTAGHLLIGARMGVGYQHSFVDVEKNGTKIMHEDMIGFAYSGYVFNIMITVGGMF